MRVLMIFIFLLFSITKGFAQVMSEKVKPNYDNLEKLVQAVEMYSGEVIKLEKLKGIYSEKKLGEILNQAYLETNKGEIHYPEEIEFAHVEAKSDFLDEAKAPHQRPPHQQN